MVKISPGRHWRIPCTVGLVLLPTAMTMPLVANWFFTPDQQGQRLFQNKEFRAAAKVFHDPLWRGTAWYRAGDFAQAAVAFGQSPTPEGWYNRGNALLMQGKYDAAITCYDKALSLRPEWSVAQDNRDLAAARARQISDAAVHQEEAVGERPDQIVVGGRMAPGSQSEMIPGTPLDLSDPALRAMWLRRVQTTPQDFLRAKFASQINPGNLEEAAP